MTNVLGLYQRTITRQHDVIGSSHSEDLLGTATTEEELRARWNEQQKQACHQHGYPAGYEHTDRIPPPFHSGVTLEFNGSTGGGYAEVKHTLNIKPVPQWDRKDYLK